METKLTNARKAEILTMALSSYNYKSHYFMCCTLAHYYYKGKITLEEEQSLKESIRDRMIKKFGSKNCTVSSKLSIKFQHGFRSSANNAACVAWYQQWIKELTRKHTKKLPQK